MDETAGSGNLLWVLRGTENCGDKSRGASDEEHCRTPLRNMQEGIMEERLSRERCVGVRAEADR